MSIARHHAEWLSLVEVSGPFLSLQVLMDAFPQGLEAHDTDRFKVLRQAYEEWLDQQQMPGIHRAGIHRAWVEWVLVEVLGYSEPVLVSGQGIPASLQVTIAEYQMTLRPDWVVVDPTTRHPQLLIQILPPDQGLEKTLKGSRWQASPATGMMELLHATGVRLGLLTNGEQWLLVNAPRGESTGYISWYSNLWLEEKLTLRAFCTLLGVRRFFGVEAQETLAALLARSKDAQQEVTDQLGLQVRKAVEVLVQAIDRIDQDRNRTLLRGISETVLYQAALTVMMRLVFLFSAEERGLLLLGDPLYDQFYAVSTLRSQLRELADQYGEELLERRYDAWARLLATFRAVFGGIHHDALQLPAYGGELFDPDRFAFLEGRSPGTLWFDTPAAPIPINNRTVLHLLEALQILQVKVPGGGAEPRRLSFRALDIEQIGHVYEGLLDHTAVRATETILGLAGTKNKEPEVALSELEGLWAKGSEDLMAFLRKETGRSEAALRKLLPSPHPLAPSPTRGEGELEKRISPPSPVLGEGGRGGEGQIDWAALAMQRLRIACNNDPALFARVLPWLSLLRLDTFEYPVVIPEGSVFVTQGTDRRETGTHYTPRSLTEEIVKYTLEPLVYVGVAEGQPREAWRLKSAADLLRLKVCDMAMGSGAFLVQVCRYLSERLVEAWEMEIPPHPPGPPLPQGARGEIEVSPVPLSLGRGARGEGVPGQIRILPDGSLSAAEPGEMILPDDPDERLAVARRIVADRCLYGVDKNPMAVEMAKLSLWLITLQKNRPFTFLDHALRCGDSLLGVTSREQIEFLHLNPDKEAVQLRTVSEIWRPLLAQAIAKRKELESFTVNDIQDLARKEALQTEAEELTRNIKIAADYLIGEALAQAGKTGNLKVEDLGVLSGLVTAALEEPEERERENKLRQIREKAQRMLNAGKPEGQPMREPFHWALEFPEVFLEEDAPKGFSAIVGNPPFLGGKSINRTFGSDYRDVLIQQTAFGKNTENADLCSYFLLRICFLNKDSGSCGVITTNTISQSDTREVGLDQILSKDKYCIYRAVSTMRWPGFAKLEVAKVWIYKGIWKGQNIIDSKQVEYISSYLRESQGRNTQPYKLAANSNKSFNGCKPYGNGFILTADETKNLMELNSKNKEVIFPYITGSELNQTYIDVDRPTRFAINFFDMALSGEMDDPKNPKGPPYAKDYPDCLNIVENKVKPERTKKKDNGEFKLRKPLPQKWWQYGDKRPALYSAINGLRRVLVRALTSKHHGMIFLPNGWIYDQSVPVLAFEEFSIYALIQSNIHYDWTICHGSSMKLDPRYTTSDCFETFPFPENTDTLETIGERYYTHRQTIMQTRQEGLTKTYNRFHDPTQTDPDIQTLRDLHIQMDTAVAAAYGWHDLTLNHDFHETKQGLRFTISEAARREILDRLLLLNHQRYAEEKAQGLHDPKKAKSKSKKAKGRKSNATADGPTQGELF